MHTFFFSEKQLRELLYERGFYDKHRRELSIIGEIHQSASNFIFKTFCSSCLGVTVLKGEGVDGQYENAYLSIYYQDGTLNLNLEFPTDRFSLEFSNDFRRVIKTILLSGGIGDMLTSLNDDELALLYFELKLIYNVGLMIKVN